MLHTALTILRMAVRPSCKSAAWLLRLMIPISLGVTLLQYYGILQWIASYTEPLFCHFGLPGASALVFITGASAGTYAGLAAMMSVHLTFRQASIMAVMVCLCHALPMECAVNRKTGSSFWLMAAIRIAMAFVAAFLLNLLLPEMPAAYVYLGAPADSTLVEVLTTWLLSQLKMSAMVCLIIFSLMIIQKFIEVRGLLRPLSHLFAPLMHLFGLPARASYMWIVGNVIGLSYGSAIMLELKDRGIITLEDANDVNYHLIMNHSMLEDTLVFAVTGISAPLIIGCRVCLAMAVVWTRRAVLVHSS